MNSELKNKSIWIIIGYSFNDPIIREIFIRNSGENKRIIYVHPDAFRIRDEKLANIKGQFFYLNEKFGEINYRDTNYHIVKQLKPNPQYLPNKLPT